MDYLEELWNLYENDLSQRMSAAVDKAKTGGTDLGGGVVKNNQIQRKPQAKPALRDPVDSTPTKVEQPIDPQTNFRNQQTKNISVARQQGMPPGQAYEMEKGPVNTGDPASVGDFSATLGMTQMDRSRAPKIEPGSNSILSKDVDQEQNNTLPDDGDLRRPSGMEISDADEQENIDADERDRIVTSDRGPAGTEDKLDTLAPEVTDQERQPGQDISPEEDPEGAEMELDAEIEDLDQILDTQWEDYSADINSRIEEMSKISELKARRLREKFDTFSKAFNKIPSTQNRSSFLSAIGKAKTYTGRINSGAGKNNLGYLDVQSLNDNRDRLLKGYGDGSPEAIEKFVRSVRSTKVDPEFVSSSFELLPDKFKEALSGKGKVGQKDVHFLGYDSDGNPKRGQASNKDRAKLMWQYYLEQGGRDAYTGLPLDLGAMDLEHVMAFDNKDNGNPSQEDYENREHEKNHVLTNSNINQKKSNMSMKDFLERELDPFSDMSEEDFAGRQAMFDRANKIGDESQQLIQTLVDDISEDGKVTGKELNSGMTMDLLRSHFENSDKSYEDLRKEFRKRSKTKEDKAKAAGLKSGLGKELLMSLGMTRGLPDKSGRRTNKMNENVYRSFLLTMAKSDPADRARLRQIWEDSIEAGRGARSEKAFRDKILELGGIDPDIISDKKLGRVFREECEWKDLVDLSEDTDYNDDVDFLRTYGRA